MSVVNNHMYLIQTIKNVSERFQDVFITIKLNVFHVKKIMLTANLIKPVLLLVVRLTPQTADAVNVVQSGN